MPDEITTTAGNNSILLPVSTGISESDLANCSSDLLILTPLFHNRDNQEYPSLVPAADLPTVHVS